MNDPETRTLVLAASGWAIVIGIFVGVLIAKRRIPNG